MDKWHQSQRGYFSGALYDEMKKNPDIFLLSGDLGYGQFDKIRDDFPGRFINCGASEGAMLGIAVGLALKGKICFVYTITSFFLRAAETINLYLHHEQIPVKLIGGGLFDDYKHDGYSHNGTMAQDYLEMLDIEKFYPKEKEEVPDMLQKILENQKPSFIGLRR